MISCSFSSMIIKSLLNSPSFYFLPWNVSAKCKSLVALRIKLPSILLTAASHETCPPPVRCFQAQRAIFLALPCLKIHLLVTLYLCNKNKELPSFLFHSAYFACNVCLQAWTITVLTLSSSSFKSEHILSSAWLKTRAIIAGHLHLPTTVIGCQVTVTCLLRLFI